MFCITLALGLICADAPKLTPAQAAAVLAPHQYVAPVQGRGPTVTIVGSSPTAGPFGEFKPYPKFLPLTCCAVYVTRLPRERRK